MGDKYAGPKFIVVSSSKIETGNFEDVSRQNVIRGSPGPGEQAM